MQKLICIFDSQIEKPENHLLELTHFSSSVPDKQSFIPLHLPRMEIISPSPHSKYSERSIPIQDIGSSVVSSEIYRGSYISAHVLLDLLHELGKRDKMRGLPSILSLFRNEFNQFNNTRARMLDSI